MIDFQALRSYLPPGTKLLQRSQGTELAASILVLIKRVPLTEEEIQKLAKRKKDFSVLDKTSLSRTSLLTDPPHLINRSCDPNAELQVMGEKCVGKVVNRHYHAEGEEMTISYGDEFWGNKNQDCLYEPCKKKKLVEPEKQTTAARVEDRVLKGHSERWCRCDGEAELWRLRAPSRGNRPRSSKKEEEDNARPDFQRRTSKPLGRQSSGARHQLSREKKMEKPTRASGVHPPKFSLKLHFPAHSLGPSPKKRKANPVQAPGGNASLSLQIHLPAQSLRPSPKRRKVIIPDQPSESRTVEVWEKPETSTHGQFCPTASREIRSTKENDYSSTTEHEASSASEHRDSSTTA
ncbi:hypothetical protein AYO20_08399 [Fonsecaea nubica]|uniref:SET domain-containing protein n=1 Tax=Fonsecaea nubica TaxID=856822 RepID=A0A178CML9_9EURO|nr:hypothetical protein AYO20_08399 [Fonsecaea nubica]OAL31068.1 hypothetical protein AYO20_08399 [Fonsecaea nubica]